MTKVRVCVGVHPDGGYSVQGDDCLRDDELKYDVLGAWVCEEQPEVSVSFHDLEVMTPQAPVVEALSSEGRTFEYGDLIDVKGESNRLRAVTRLWPSERGQERADYIDAYLFHKIKEPTSYDSMCKMGLGGSIDGWNVKYLTLLAKAGNWHIADGKVVLSPPTQPEPEVKTKFQFGDLVQPNYQPEKYVVCHPSLKYRSEPGVSVILPEYFHKLSEPTHYTDVCRMLGHGDGPSGGKCDGCVEHAYKLIASAGQWHINSSGEVILKPKPEVPKPKFKRGDKVQRIQNGHPVNWVVVDPVPDADDMIVLLWPYLELVSSLQNWSDCVTAFGESNCGHYYRMSYEDDCTLVPEVTAPPVRNTIPLDPVIHYVDINDVVYRRGESLKPGDMVVDFDGKLWDVHDTSGNGINVWLRPVGEPYTPRKPVPARTLKKVVFGTL